MKNQWIICGIAILFCEFAFNGSAQIPKPSIYEPDIVDKPKEFAKENYKGKLFDEENSEKMPQFPGGEVELLKFIHSNIRYPALKYQDDMIDGKVIVRFVVTKNGDVSTIEILRSLEPWSDREAVRVVKLFPKFIPGEQNGKKVDVWYTIPVTFKRE